METSPAASPILREYYRTGVGRDVTAQEMRSAAYQASHPWSAVFVSYVMRRAGAGTTFRYSAAHQTYVRAARENRLRADTANPFWAYRAIEVQPAVGDLVCAARQNSGATYDNIGDNQRRATHCDVVVEVRPGRIRVIGGNVGQTVGEKWLRTRPDGRLDPSGTQSRIFAVVQCRNRRPGSAGPHPVSAGLLPVPAGLHAVPAGLQARVQRVMELLVRRYGFPVNGAAGIAGNLIAESSVLPNRIEGSREATPMRARDFTGRVRDFTPDEIRDRDFRRRTGPRSPGIGLAQWTSPQRRSGLFRHVFNGRRPGSAILFDLDAQVDYLVHELRRDYRSVNAVLTAPGVTTNQASDVVVLRFERPAAVLDKPLSDPGVQAVLRHRRTHAAEALRIHRSTSTR
ncbi:hypothetical protein SAMN04488564_12235 [Lentzea waywayandensis]|uniref:DUF2272 domain-containing protein n=1 Tax=Lentzea waywayandensis TaxID=84724 RepID=A0A1I6FIT3_9PSEU|nr:hypothetical protein SAMN04488564_12235 [Lentzea waywayandensis]